MFWVDARNSKPLIIPQTTNASTGPGSHKRGVAVGGTRANGGTLPKKGDTKKTYVLLTPSLDSPLEISKLFLKFVI